MLSHVKFDPIPAVRSGMFGLRHDLKKYECSLIALPQASDPILSPLSPRIAAGWRIDSSRPGVVEVPSPMLVPDLRRSLQLDHV